MTTRTDAAVPKPGLAPAGPRRRLRRFTIAGALLAVAVAAWCVLAPGNGFGPCWFGFTTFARWPLPIVDLAVRADGSWQRVRKTHDLQLIDLQWLLDEQPEDLVISLGWDGVVAPRAEVTQANGPKLHLLRNREALERFRQLRAAGRRVAIHYHSTC